MFNLAVKKNFEKNLPLKVYGNLKALNCDSFYLMLNQGI